MATRAPGGRLVACTASCLDVVPGHLQRGPDQPTAPSVLASIENLPPATAKQTIRSPQSKRQRHLTTQTATDQGQKQQALDATELFAQARSLLRQLPEASAPAPVSREQQYQALQDALQGFVSSGSGSSLYVSGLPGTGVWGGGGREGEKCGFVLCVQGGEGAQQTASTHDGCMPLLPDRG
jgi:hypothetical protein